MLPKTIFTSPQYKMFQRVIWSVSACWAIYLGVQSIPYYTHLGAGKEDYKKGKYTSAEVNFKAAVNDSKSYSDIDARKANALNNLAELYRTQGRYEEAENEYKQVVAITERLGEKHQG